MAPTYRDFLMARGLMQQQRPPVPPPIDYGGGGGGVTANSVLGQRGPVKVDPAVYQAALQAAARLGQRAPGPMLQSAPGLVTQPPSVTMPRVPSEPLPVNVALLPDMSGVPTALDPRVRSGMFNEAAQRAATEIPLRAGLAAAAEQDVSGSVAIPEIEVAAAELPRLYDIPRQWNSGNWGDVIHQLANGDRVLAFSVLGSVPVGKQFVEGLETMFANDPDLVARINAAHAAGGGRAVWEDVVAAASDTWPWYLKYPVRAITDTLVDPLGVPLMLTTGGGKALGDVALDAALRGQAGRAAVANVAGKAMRAPQAILDVTVDAPFNLAGKAISAGISKLRGGRLLDEAAGEVVEDTRAQVGDAIGAYEQAAADLQPGTAAAVSPPVGEAPTPVAPSVSGRYTKVEQEVPGRGMRWVILDPEGNPVDDMAWRPARATDTEPNYAARVADTRVNELNRPAELAAMETAEVVVPPPSWAWMDPTQHRLTRTGADRTSRSVLSTVVFDRGRVPAPAARQIVDDLTPAVEEHIRVLDEISREVDPAMKRAGLTGEDAVQRGTDLADPRKTWEMVRFHAEDVLPTWRKYMGDAEPDPYVFRYGDTLDTRNINNVIEHAVFGTNEQAIAARKFLRSSQGRIGDLTGLTAGEQAAKWRKALFGEGALSQDPAAVKSRRIRENRALEPVPNEAALREMGMGPVERPPVVERAVPSSAPGPTPKPVTAAEITQAMAAPKPPRMKARRRPKQTIDLRGLSDVDAIKMIDDPDVRFQTPGGFRIARIQAGQFSVSSTRRIDRDVTDVTLTPRTGASPGWDVSARGGAERIATTDTLGEAIAVADWHLGGKVDGGVGIVPPGMARAINLEPRVTRDILRQADALAGTGGPVVNDPSPIGAMVNQGAIDRATYDRLRTPVEFEGDVMPLYQAYDLLVMHTGDPAEARRIIQNLVAPLDQETFKSARVTKKLLMGYDATLQTWREQLQFNVARGPSAALADQVGNSYTALVTGRPVEAMTMWNPVSWLRLFRADRAGKDLIQDLPGADRLQRLNVTPPPTVMQMRFGRTETGTGDMLARRGMQKIGLTGRVSGTAYGVLANKAIRDFRHALDRNSRWTLFTGDFFRTLRRNRLRFYGMVQERARLLGRETDGARWVEEMRGITDDLTPDDVLRITGVDKLARDWRELISEASATANKAVNDRLFSYRGTNADALLRRFVFFHYWQSRAFLLHTRTTLQNPWLLNAYFRGWENLKQEAEERNYPPGVRGYLAVMGSAVGWYGLVNPLGVLVPFAMLVETGQDDESTMEWIRRHGAFINPWIEGAAAAIGWTDRAPDLTGTRAVRRAVRATINALNSSGLDRLAPGQAGTYQTSDMDRFTARVFEVINRYGSQVPIPGATDVTFSDPSGYEMDQLNAVLIDLAEDEWGPMDAWGEAEWTEYTAAVTAIQTGQPGNDLANDAIEQYTEATAAGTLASVIVPGGIVTRYGPRDTDLAQSRAGYAALDAGAQPTPEQQASMDARGVATAGSPEDLRLDWQADAYREIGTTRQRSIADGWNAIAHGPPDTIPDYYEVTVGGMTLTVFELRRMDEASRKALADAWVAEVGGTEDLAAYRDERAAYIAQHPEYGNYDEWRDMAYDYAGGVRTFRIDRAAGNPNFRRAMGEREDYLRKQGTDAALIADELDQWAVSLAGYKAAQGIRDSAYAPDPLSTGDQATVNTLLRAGVGGDGGSGSGGTSAPKSTASKLKADIAEYQGQVKAFDQILAGVGITSDFASINNPLVLRGLQAQFGDVMPEPSRLLREYWAWVETVQRVNPNADTSPEAFARALDALDQAA